MSGNYEIGICDDQSIIPYPENIEIENIVLYKEKKNDFNEEEDEEEDNMILYTDSLYKVEEIMDFLNLNSLQLVNILDDSNMFRFSKIIN